MNKSLYVKLKVVSNDLLSKNISGKEDIFNVEFFSHSIYLNKVLLN